jgi:transcriptional regulator with XRE-family HTH domain
MEQSIAEVVKRIHALREDMGFSLQEMAEATGLSMSEYEAAEAGEVDLTFTFLYRCAEKLDVDIIELLTGEGPHLTGYSVVRSGRGLAIKRRAGFEYRHLAPTFKDKTAEPFIVTAPFSDADQNAPINLSRHAGQELDYVLTGRLRFAYENHVEELGPGDTVYYDSGRGHGMIATGGEPCTFLAVVMKDHDAESV